MLDIQDIINQSQENYNKFIVETLKRYLLFTGDEELYRSMLYEYPELNITYSPYIRTDSDDGKIFAFHRDNLQPITLSFGDCQTHQDPVNMRYTCSCKMGVEIGGVLI